MSKECVGGVRKSESGSSKRPSKFDSPSERAARNPNPKTPGKVRKALGGDQTPEGLKKQQLKTYGVTIDPERDGSLRKRVARDFFTGTPINKKGLTPDQRKVYKKSMRKTRLKVLGTTAAVVAIGYGMDYAAMKIEQKHNGRPVKVSDVKKKNKADNKHKEKDMTFLRNYFDRSAASAEKRRRAQWDDNWESLIK